jgi:NAD(P)-dependent dehydrogenase (short-subunit alcohol dehydrogenase family)
MVNLPQVKESNGLISATTAPRVAVFVGGTAGIGKATVASLAKLKTPLKAYVIGRKSSKDASRAFIAELQQTNPDADVVFLEGEVSLLAEVKRICDYIKTIESSVDLLFMTTGYAPFVGRENTAEGLDTSHALEFYSRMCFTENLLPLLRASGRARVISVLGGGFERASLFNVDDLNLEKPGAFGAMATQGHMMIMNTLFLERLAEDAENHAIVFMHSHPGIVRTGNLFRGWAEGGWGIWMASVFMDPMLRLLAFSGEESAERYLYQVTSAIYGGKGVEVKGFAPGRTTKGKERGGLFLVSRYCDTVMNEKEMAKLRVTAQEKVWEKTHEIIGPTVAM